MKYLFLALSLSFNIYFLYPVEPETVKETNPQDTVKVYYLDEVVVSSSVKETNDLRNMPTAVSVVSPKQLKDSQIESLPGLSAYIPN
ncbi:MAG: TonB-dependent receptor, partial [Proteiniphilum sp.]